MINEAGIGMMYLPGLESLIESFSEQINVIELEPQTTWYKKSLENDSFRFDSDSAEWLKQFNKPLIFHGVGFPVGGTIKADENHFKTMNSHVDCLQPIFVSEHLSFNKFSDNTGVVSQLNFLLPVIQNQLGIDTAVANIQQYRNHIHLPFAFETGVNYFKPLKNEIPDGYFFREIAEKSDSYILLDIHNLLANELNGRQKIKELIKMLPLDRVIEIHLAGGHYFHDYYLDAHSSVSSVELFAITDFIIKQLPNVKAIIFEMIPEYYERTVTEQDVSKQLDEMTRIWDHRGKDCKSRRNTRILSHHEDIITPQEWEFTLANLINSEPVDSNLGHLISNDPGLSIIKDLVFQFRASAIVSALKITCRYIRLMTDNSVLNTLLHEFCSKNPSEIFGYANGIRFAKFIKEKQTDIRYLDDVVDFEIAAMTSVIDGEKRIINLPFEPYQLLNALIQNTKPELNTYSGVVYETELTQDSIAATPDMLMKIETVYHN